MEALDIAIALLTIVILFLIYRWLMTPIYQRTINRLGDAKWSIDNSAAGVQNETVQYSDWVYLSDSHGTVLQTNYGIDGQYLSKSTKEWSQHPDGLKIGAVRVLFVPGEDGGFPTLRRSSGPGSVSAPMKELTS